MWAVLVGTSGELLFYRDSTQLNTATSSSSNKYMTAGVRNHIAWVREGNALTVFINGNWAGRNNTFTHSLTATAPLYVASPSGTFGWYNGRIDNLRITKGVARYPGTTSFTPPTGPHPTS